ncbi:MAG: hypothetical protein FJ088_05350 [Deltaproteobacteria bacterium]|nr:hypothetical protein [Deltaproteobacteria bacterium]
MRLMPYLKVQMLKKASAVRFQSLIDAISRKSAGKALSEKEIEDIVNEAVHVFCLCNRHVGVR